MGIKIKRGFIWKKVFWSSMTFQIILEIILAFLIEKYKDLKHNDLETRQNNSIVSNYIILKAKSSSLGLWFCAFDPGFCVKYVNK